MFLDVNPNRASFNRLDVAQRMEDLPEQEVQTLHLGHPAQTSVRLPCVMIVVQQVRRTMVVSSAQLDRPMNAYVDDRPFSVDLAAAVRDKSPFMGIDAHTLET